MCKESGAAAVEQIIADLTLREDTNKVAEVGCVPSVPACGPGLTSEAVLWDCDTRRLRMHVGTWIRRSPGDPAWWCAPM